MLSKILHPTQFAQPGKQIFELNCLIRDLLNDMEEGNQDCFFIQYDFHKAFDSISHDFLVNCLSKMNFPEEFITFIKNIYKNAVSKVMINGHLTKIIKLMRGARQGDPLSLYIFIIVLNVFITFVNNDGLLIPYKTKKQ